MKSAVILQVRWVFKGVKQLETSSASVRVAEKGDIF